MTVPFTPEATVILLLSTLAFASDICRVSDRHLAHVQAIAKKIEGAEVILGEDDDVRYSDNSTVLYKASAHPHLKGVIIISMRSQEPFPLAKGELTTRVAPFLVRVRDGALFSPYSDGPRTFPMHSPECHEKMDETGDVLDAIAAIEERCNVAEFKPQVDRLFSMAQSSKEPAYLGELPVPQAEDYPPTKYYVEQTVDPRWIVLQKHAYARAIAHGDDVMMILQVRLDHEGNLRTMSYRECSPNRELALSIIAMLPK